MDAADLDALEEADEELPPGLLKAVRADPDHAPELLMRFAVERLAADAETWAARTLAAHPGVHPAALAAQIRQRTTWSSLVAGAISGTPFFLALVPAYVSVLWDQAWMTLRMAALFGYDVRSPTMTAELLVLRGVHPTVAEAQEALDALGTRPDRRLAGGYRGWWRLARRVMVLAGFMEPDDGAPPPGLAKRALLFVIGAGLYLFTWIAPLSFMIVMAQSCSVSTRRMAQGTFARYAPPEDAAIAPPPRRHRFLTVALAVIGAGVPIAAIVWANDITQSSPETWARGLGVLLGLALVLSLYAFSRRVPG